MDGPCLNCEDRKLYCHSTCEKYTEMKKQIKEVNKKYRQYMDGRGRDTNLAPKSRIKSYQRIRF